MIDAIIIADSLYVFRCEKEIESIYNLVNVSNDVISNEISAVNTLLTIISIILAVASVGLGVYITSLRTKVVQIKRDVDSKSERIKSIAKTVEDTDNKIQSDIRSLYKQLKEEETLSLLERLKEEPLDIANLTEILLSRVLPIDGFVILKSAFKGLIDIPKSDISAYERDESTKRYQCLFFQNYTYESLMDNDLRGGFIRSFSDSLSCAFKRDVVQSTNDLCRALSERIVPFDRKVVLIKFLEALNVSQYKDSRDIKSILEERISYAGLLTDAIDACTSKGIYLSLFGIEKPNGLIPQSQEQEKLFADKQ